MSDEKKTYSVVGTVTIGADEYRDLIEEVAEAKKEAERNDKLRWDEYRRANKAEDENKELRKAVNTQVANAQKLRDFIYADEQRAYELKMYMVDLAAKEDDDNE